MFADLVDLVLPAACAGCEQPSARPLCGPCWAAFRAATPQRTRPDPEPPGMPPTYALAAYAGAVRRAILQYKEKDRRELTGPLGQVLAGVVWRALGGWRGPVLLVPVPATAAAARKRHGDHMLRLARAAARALPDAAVMLPLRALPKATDSAELSAAERAEAARNAFATRKHGTAARPVRAGTAVVVVDDIVTTGVTLAAAVASLESAGFGVDRAAVLAATQRRR